MMRVLLVDDEPRLCSAWERLFAMRTDMQLVGTLLQADGLQNAVATLTPDIVVIDLTMPGEDPLEAVRKVIAAHPEIKVIVFSGHSGVEHINAAFDAGAAGYMDKLTPPSKIFTLIQSIAAGETVFPSVLVDPGTVIRFPATSGTLKNTSAPPSGGR